jgi:hypothetical protein
VSAPLAGAAWVGLEKMLRPSPAAKATAFHNGFFGAIGWPMGRSRITGKDCIVTFRLLSHGLS